jgi:Zn-dependent peptidase ImmA (M78 family)
VQEFTLKKRDPVKEAHKLLMMIYESMKKSGHPTDFESFYPIDLNAVVRLLGWEVDRVQEAVYVGSERSDGTIDFDNKKITLSFSGIPEGRQNYSLAHEIGHIMLHGKEGIQTMLRAHSIREMGIFPLNYPIEYEVEADRFAKELLMPRRAVRRRFCELFGCKQIVAGTSIAFSIVNSILSRNPRRQKMDVSDLAREVARYAPDPQLGSLSDFFDVSIQAMAYRLKELRLVLE